MQTVKRLIDQFIPNEYQLELDLQRKMRHFEGSVTIRGTSPNGGGQLSVHAKDLTIASVTVDGKSADFTHGEHDELSISHPDITEGPHVVVIDFSGTITDAMHGMYPCYYEIDGVKKELLATQFESHHAREVFPCIDEPAAKAVFDLTLKTETGVTVLSNTEIKEQTESSDRLTTTFMPTPRMSTYLLAWATGELQKRSGRTDHGTEVNVWSTLAHAPNNLDFALDIAIRTIDFFEEYFGVPYPLTKCDHIALPDFSSGAMENWGLITYREMALLADPSTTSISSKHYIATVIAHELSHMWFGNLVTMKWWNDLWLNESFATLMEYVAIDNLHPEWNVWLDFATNETIMALRRDSIEGVQSVQVEVKHPDEISTLFDGAIVYAKGARLMRMLEQYVGTVAFQDGLKSYFTKYAYKNCEGDDLWRELSLASGKDVASFMNAWISQSGFPIVRASSLSGQVSLTQEQFFIGPHGPSAKLWPIPLGGPSGVPELMSEKTISFAWSGQEALRLNHGDAAHFITEYDEPLMANLIEQIEAGRLAPLDRLQILNEQTLLARAGAISSASLIPLLSAYRREESEPVWDIIALSTKELKKFVEGDEPSEQKLRDFVGSIAREQYNRLGWERTGDEAESDTKLRATIISLMLYSEDRSVINEALRRFESTELERLDPELRPLIIGAAVRHGGDDSLIDRLIEIYPKTSSPELQKDIFSGITSTKSVSKLNELLDYSKNPAVVRPQDAARWFMYIIHNKYGREAAWQWLQNNWAWVETTFGGDKSYDDYPRIASGALMTRQQLSEYQDFFRPMQAQPALTRIIILGTKEITGRVNLIERDKDDVRSKLLEQ